MVGLAARRYGLRRPDLSEIMTRLNQSEPSLARAILGRSRYQGIDYA
jgi:hypothetical protein